MKPLTLDEIRSAHPMPWKTLIYPKGQVVVLDTNNQEVPLMVLTQFACDITTAMARQRAQAAEPNSAGGTAA